jgi:hypothetical protein
MDQNLLITCFRYQGSPLWSSGQSSWLQIQRSGFISRRYQIFWQVMGLEWGPLSLVSTTEGPFERKSSGSGLENREYGCRDMSWWPHATLYPRKLELTSSTSGGRSVSIVRSRTQATEFFSQMVGIVRSRTKATELVNLSSLRNSTITSIYRETAWHLCSRSLFYSVFLIKRG